MSEKEPNSKFWKDLDFIGSVSSIIIILLPFFIGSFDKLFNLPSAKESMYLNLREMLTSAINNFYSIGYNYYYTFLIVEIVFFCLLFFGIGRFIYNLIWRKRDEVNKPKDI